MPTIALPKLRDDRPPVEYRVRLDPGLNEDLLLYRRLYVQTYGQEIEPKDLLEPIVRRFLATDRSFRKFKKQHPVAPASAGVGSAARSDQYPKGITAKEPGQRDSFKRHSMNHNSIKPIVEVRRRTVKAAIWKNAVDNGNSSRPLFAATFQRLYRDSAGKWQSADSFGRDDLLILALVAQLSFERIHEFQESERQTESANP